MAPVGVGRHLGDPAEGSHDVVGKSVRRPVFLARSEQAGDDRIGIHRLHHPGIVREEARQPFILKHRPLRAEGRKSAPSGIGRDTESLLEELRGARLAYVPGQAHDILAYGRGVLVDPAAVEEEFVAAQRNSVDTRLHVFPVERRRGFAHQRGAQDGGIDLRIRYAREVPSVQAIRKQPLVRDDPDAGFVHLRHQMPEHVFAIARDDPARERNDPHPGRSGRVGMADLPRDEVQIIRVDRHGQKRVVGPGGDVNARIKPVPVHLQSL